MNRFMFGKDRDWKSLLLEPALEEFSLLQAHSVDAIKFSQWPQWQKLPSIAYENSCEDLAWPDEPIELATDISTPPELDENMLPPHLKTWVMDICERNLVAPEFVITPALISLSSLVGSKIAIMPKRNDDNFIVANLWGAALCSSDYFDSQAYNEAMLPLQRLIDNDRVKNQNATRTNDAKAAITRRSIDLLSQQLQLAIKEENYKLVYQLEQKIIEQSNTLELADTHQRRYKTSNDQSDVIAHLLQDHPHGILLAKRDLGGWLSRLADPQQETERDFFIKAWHGSGSYVIDRAGLGFIQVPNLNLSIFGGIEQSKLLSILTRKNKRNNSDSGALNRLQILLSSPWSMPYQFIDRKPNLVARETTFEIFDHVDRAMHHSNGYIPAVRFSDEAQAIYDAWIKQSNRSISTRFLQNSPMALHQSYYPTLVPKLALLFWIIENPENIQAWTSVSASATKLAVNFCTYLEQHAIHAYRLKEQGEVSTLKILADHIKNGGIINGSSLKILEDMLLLAQCKKREAEYALAALQNSGWLRIIPGKIGSSKKKIVELHPKFREPQA